MPRGRRKPVVDKKRKAAWLIPPFQILLEQRREDLHPPFLTWEHEHSSPAKMVAMVLLDEKRKKLSPAHRRAIVTFFRHLTRNASPKPPPRPWKEGEVADRDETGYTRPSIMELLRHLLGRRPGDTGN